MDEPAIKVDNLNKDFIIPHEKQGSIKSLFINFYRRKRTYELQHALQDINFEVKKGEFFGIVGRNGSGKSTLLKIIAGIYTPTSGNIKVNGSLTPFIELGVGFNPELTGRENVFLNGALLGFSRKQMMKMYDEIVEFAELERFMDLKLKNFSSGMQVRLAFSIAIRAQGDILLLDEVLAVGDSSFQRKCLDFFKEIKKTDRTIVLVTHNMGTVEEYCDRALMLENSKILAIGDPISIAAQYELANSNISTKQNTKSRPKEPQVKIQQVTIHSQSSKSDKFLLTDDVIVQVKLSVKKVTPFQISLSLYNMDGEYVSGISSKNDLPSFNPGKGQHTLSCMIESGQLPNGSYRLNVNVTTDEDHPKLIDVASSEYGVSLPIITFAEKSAFKNGKFYLAASWSKDS